MLAIDHHRTGTDHRIVNVFGYTYVFTTLLSVMWKFASRQHGAWRCRDFVSALTNNAESLFLQVEVESILYIHIA